jgi:hypothetical protein
MSLVEIVEIQLTWSHVQKTLNILFAGFDLGVVQIHIVSPLEAESVHIRHLENPFGLNLCFLVTELAQVFRLFLAPIKKKVVVC